MEKKKNFKEQYERISQSEWFKKAYEDKSVGDTIPIEDALDCFASVNVDDGTYIVSRKIDNKKKTIVIKIEPYSNAEYNRLIEASKDGSYEDFVNLDADLESAMTTARVYKRAYENLFYTGYDIEILIKVE